MARTTPPPAWMYDRDAARAHADLAHAEADNLERAHGQYGPHVERVFQLRQESALARAVAAAPHGQGRMHELGNAAIHEHQRLADSTTGERRAHHRAAIVLLGGAAGAQQTGMTAKRQPVKGSPDAHRGVGPAIQHGKKGGAYYLTPSGKRVYIGGANAHTTKR